MEVQFQAGEQGKLPCTGYGPSWPTHGPNQGVIADDDASMAIGPGDANPIAQPDLLFAMPMIAQGNQGIAKDAPNTLEET